MLRGFESRDSQTVKLAANLVDVCERQGASVRAIRQQNEDAFSFRIDPATCSGETRVTESIVR